jgi:hypothetical protein
MKTLKNSIPIFLISLVAFWGCQKSPATLTDAEKEEIKKEILEKFNNSLQGIKDKDAATAFGAFSEKEGVKYIRDGHLYPDIETAEKQYAGWFAADTITAKRIITCDPIIFDILDENTVLLTTIGSFIFENDTTNQPWVLAYTMLWRNEEGGWKLFHMHNSWE